MIISLEQGASDLKVQNSVMTRIQSLCKNETRVLNSTVFELRIFVYKLIG